MTDVISLVLPFFGLILLGYVAARLVRQPVEALGWMTIFIIYCALPALFFQLLSKTPVEQLTAWNFVAGSLLATFCAFVLMFAAAIAVSGGNIAESTIKGLAAAYGNIGYMGPGIALLAFGEQAAVPVAIIFCFENIMHFTLAPALMALSGSDERPAGAVALDVLRKVALHPFILATAAGVLAAFIGWRPHVAVERLMETLARGAAPCALFAMGVTLALRPLKRMPETIPAIALVKLAVHPALCYLLLGLMGDFDPVWVFSAVLLAALPTATNVFVIAQQYGVWVERASATILITTVLSVLTVTGLLYVMTNGMLPPDPFPSGAATAAIR